MTTAPPATQPAKTLGNRLDAWIASLDRQPLVAVGAGIVVGFLLARMLDR